MPIDAYYKGAGSRVLADMERSYGVEKAKKVFYSLAAKKKMRPEDDVKRGLEPAAPAAEPDSLPRIRRKYSLEGRKRLV
jgi:hypothetical protein